jgi:PIN domain nuclease of toxin-antitoxin system
LLIWLAHEPAKPSRSASEAIRKSSESRGLAISAIALWELAWLAAPGRWQLRGTMDTFVGKISSRTAIHPITVRIAVLADQSSAD